MCFLSNLLDNMSSFYLFSFVLNDFLFRIIKLYLSFSLFYLLLDWTAVFNFFIISEFTFNSYSFNLFPLLIAFIRHFSTYFNLYSSSSEKQLFFYSILFCISSFSPVSVEQIGGVGLLWVFVDIYFGVESFKELRALLEIGLMGSTIFLLGYSFIFYPYLFIIWKNRKVLEQK